MLLAAAAAALTMASCQKNESLETEDSAAAEEVVSLDISVGGLDGGDAATKAIKKGWAVGDKINIWYDNNSAETPDLVIRYDGTAWMIDDEAAVSGKTPAASGTLNALYEASNDFSSNYSAGYFHVSQRIVGSNVYPIPMGACAKSIAYTFSDGRLTSAIDSWTFLSNLQVVITGIDPSEAENYGLRIMVGSSFVSSSISGYRRTYSGFSGNNHIGEFALGTANEDGVAFYVQISSSVLRDPEFIVFDRSRNVQWHYRANGKTITKDDSKCVAVKFNKSNLSIYKIPYDGLCFVINGTNATVTGNREFFTNSYSGDVTVPETVSFDGVDYTVTTLGQSCFQYSYVTSVSLPETVKTFDAYAFTECKNLTSLVIPKGVTGINTSNGVFDGSSLLNISVSPENTKYFVEDGVLYFRRTSTTYQVSWIQENRTGELVLKPGTVEIGSNNCPNINVSRIVFPEGFDSCHWGLGSDSVGADDLICEFSDADYEAFYRRYRSNWSNFAYCFGRNSIGKVTLSISSASEEDWAKYKALKDTFHFKNIVDRRTGETY